MITCIIYDLSALEVAQMIQFMSFLQVNEFVHDLFMGLGN